MLADYFINPLQVSLFHKFKEIIVVRVIPFTLLEYTFSYTSKDCVGKNIPLKDIPSGTREPLKETKRLLEEKNDKQLHTRTGGPLKKKEMPRDEEGRRVHTYAEVLSTRKLSNEREK